MLGRTLSDAAAEKADQNKASVSTTASIRVDVSGASRLRRAIWAITGSDPNLQVWGMKWPDWGLPLVKQESKSAELSDNYVVKHAQTKHQRLYEELQKRKKAAANAKLAAENAKQKEDEAKKALTDAGFSEEKLRLASRGRSAKTLAISTSDPAAPPAVNSPTPLSELELPLSAKSVSFSAKELGRESSTSDGSPGSPGNKQRSRRTSGRRHLVRQATRIVMESSEDLGEHSGHHTPRYHVPMRRQVKIDDEYKLAPDWMDTFLDLIFVGAAYKLGNLVKESFYTCASAASGSAGSSGSESADSGARSGGRLLAADSAGDQLSCAGLGLGVLFSIGIFQALYRCWLTDCLHTARYDAGDLFHTVLGVFGDFLLVAEEGNGMLSQEEVVRGLIKTYRLASDLRQVRAMRQLVAATWDVFADGPRGGISRAAFLRPHDGLADAIVANLASDFRR